MNSISKVVKRGYTAVFGEDTQDDSPSKQRKIAVPTSMLPTHGERAIRRSDEPPVAQQNHEGRHNSMRRTSSGTGSRDSQAAPEIAKASARQDDAPRIVPVGRGSKQNLALLMTDDLLAAWKSTCEQTRKTEAFTQQADARRDVLNSFLRHARTEIEEMRYQRYTLRDRHADLDAMLRIERREHEIMEKIDLANRRKAEDEDQIASLEWDLARESLTANMFIHYALIDRKMMVSDEDFEFELGPDPAFLETFKVPDVRERTPVDRSVERRFDGRLVYGPDPDFVPSEFVPSEAESEVDRPGEHVLEQEFRGAYHDLRRAEAKFDRRERETARCEDHAAATALDIAHLERNNRLTRELVQAEERFALAKRAAAENNLDLLASEQSSGFGPVDGDIDKPERRLSYTPHPADLVVKDPRIIAWLEDPLFCLDDPPGHQLQENVERSSGSPDDEDAEWERTSLVSPEDSYSVRADGRQRERIDRDNAHRDELRGQTLPQWEEHVRSQQDLGPEQPVPSWDEIHSRQEKAFWRKID
ncbi:unnamed protein product [Zymoseptoria tritici ST99CH_3D1]|nr:unnamed protein product [Zymoseptoria tritici ST99CH_3D1]